MDIFLKKAKKERKKRKRSYYFRGFKHIHEEKRIIYSEFRQRLNSPRIYSKKGGGENISNIEEIRMVTDECERECVRACVRAYACAGADPGFLMGFDLIILPYLLNVFGQLGLSKYCRPRS